MQVSRPKIYSKEQPASFTVCPPMILAFKHMMIRTLSITIGFLLWCSLASAAGIEKNETPLETWKNSLRERLKNCAGPLELRAKIPVVANSYPLGSPLAVISLSMPGLVSDGYSYDLHVYGNSNNAYIIQMGGITGGQVVYGPLRLDSTCLTP